MRPTATASLRPRAFRCRLCGKSDRENLIALERDPQVMRFLNGGRSIPDEGKTGPVSSRLAAAKLRVGGARDALGRLPRMVLAPPGRRRRRRARLQAPPRSLGPWLRLGGRRGARRPGFRRHGPSAHRRHGDDGSHRFAAGPGEGGPHLCANCLSGRGRFLSGNRTGRRQVRDNARGMGATRPFD